VVDVNAAEVNEPVVYPEPALTSDQEELSLLCCHFIGPDDVPDAVKLTVAPGQTVDEEAAVPAFGEEQLYS
jgi:hypothetical protein